MNVQPPIRVSRRYVQHLQAPAEVVFPLLCPVREIEWVEGWKPDAVYSFSGYAEPDCVFTTSEGDEEATWVVTTHDPSSYSIEFVKVTPGVMVTRIEIALQHAEPDTTEAEVTYTYTALSKTGQAAVEAMTESAYERFMQRWETALNDYLRSRSPPTS